MAYKVSNWSTWTVKKLISPKIWDFQTDKDIPVSDFSSIPPIGKVDHIKEIWIKINFWERLSIKQR